MIVRLTIIELAFLMSLSILHITVNFMLDAISILVFSAKNGGTFTNLHLLLRLFHFPENNKSCNIAGVALCLILLLLYKAQ